MGLIKSALIGNIRTFYIYIRYSDNGTQKKVVYLNIVPLASP